MTHQKIGMLLAAGIALLLLAWAAGELHRQSCLTAHRAGCSVLPWVSGHAPSSNGWGYANNGYLVPGNGWGP